MPTIGYTWSRWVEKTGPIRAVSARVAKRLRGAFDLRDVFVFGGLACAVYGVAQVHEPAAWVAAGSALFWLGVRKP